MYVEREFEACSFNYISSGKGKVLISIELSALEEIFVNNCERETINLGEFSGFRNVT